MTTMTVNFNGETSVLQITKVERSKLYGRKLKIVVDENGDRCTQAFLTSDGAALLPDGCIANVTVDDHFNLVEHKQLKAVDADKKPIEPVPSTLKTEQALTGPITAQRVLDHSIKSVYQLHVAPGDSGDFIGPNLEAALKAGAIFEAKFNYKVGWASSPCFILANAEGRFALIGQPTGFDFVKRDDPPPVEDGDSGEDEDEDLDFSMM